MTESNPQNSVLPSVMKHLQALVEATGPSGSEEDVVQLVVKAARPHADTLDVDAFGNVIAVRHAAQADARRCVISAHMDEVGFRVYKIGGDGFLRLEKLGGLDDRILPAQRVWIRTDSGERLLGVIGTKSAHLLGDADRANIVPYASLYVDLGARSRQEVLDMGVAVGDPVGFVGSLTELGRQTGRYTAHALDDRAGCAVLLTLLERFHETPPPVTLVLVFSVQEEVGLRGVSALARHIQADVALALDMTAADDTPEFSGPHLQLGAGPTVKMMDASTQAHPAIRRGLLGAARKRGVAIQREVLKGIGTDAGALQYLGQGVPTGAISVVNRYTHSPVEVLDSRDLEGAVALLEGFLHDLPDLDLRFVALDETGSD
ncbi:M42 family metallopeptidase [Deinococcus marmoris]|uniref:Hydrolase n=1 Tax=Deinococcus marmoris TaxID=249408 RepID=A0A1U7NTN4_9DEIO|nr:M42 family metallopeptidase [Deinococcus marmoris]OLV16276.1 hydrolase [Deinococcus marmoris]